MRSAGLSSASASADSEASTAGDLRNPSRLLRDLTDLFISRLEPSGGESLRYEDIACKLVKDADGAARAYTAARICSHPAAPVILIDTLLESDSTCAKILVEHCSRVSPRHLLHYAAGEDPSLAAAVARRRKLTSEMARALAERPELVVLRDLAANPQVDLSGDLLARLVEAARRDPVLARLVVSRATDPVLIAPLFLYADADQRKAIFAAAERQTFPAHEIASIKLIGPALINWLVRRKPASSWDRIAAELARVIGQPADTVSHLLRDPQGDGIALLFAAAGMPGPEAVRFLLHCPPQISHSCERVRTLSKVIESMPAHAARRLIRTIAGEPASAMRSDTHATTAAHQPLHDVRAAAYPGRGTAQPVRPASCPPATPERKRAS
jgi:hypothetical protein